MTLAHNELELELIATAKSFRDNFVADHANDWERARKVPTDIYAKAVSAGLMALEVPVERGGRGMRYSVKMTIAEELSKACMAFAFGMINTQNVANRIAREASANAAERYLDDLLAARTFGATALTEPTAGSDFSNIQMTAVSQGGDWVLNGGKTWITNAAVADVFVVYAQTDPTAGWRGIASFLVDARRDGFRRHDPIQMHGGHAIGTAGFDLEDYVVPEADILAPAGEAFKLALHSINGARTYVAAMCCGMVSDALDKAVTYGRSRHAFGRPLIEHQGLAWSLADVATELEAARLLTYKAASLIDQDDPGAVLAAAHAKKYAARMAERAIPQCMQAMGAHGLREEYGLGRHLACARIAHYVDGTTEIQNERIAALGFQVS